MQRAAALRARLGEWVGEARTRRAQLSAISAALDEFSAVPAAAPGNVLQLAPVSELARLAIEFNELIMAHVMSISFRVADDIVEWQVRKENRYWFLWEKTPLFWAQYLLAKEREPLALEARKKMAKLQQLQRNLTALLGAGSRLVDMYTTSMQDENPDALLRVVCANERVLRTCFGLVSRIMVDDTTDISTALSAQFFALPTDECTLRDATKALQHNVSAFPDFRENLDQLVSTFGRPLYVAAHWMTYTLYSFAAYMALRSISQNRFVIIDTFQNLRQATRNFADRYIIAPIIEMYRTIRYDKSSFHVIDPSEIQADEESLVRMVSDYVSTHKVVLTETEKRALAASGPRSEFGFIMYASELWPLYERAMEKPIQNAVFGDLFRLLLIQVQKGRVDAERALQALDKLLRANELNFQMLALVPAVFVSYLTTSATLGFLFRRPNQRSLHRKLQLEMRNVSRILTEAQSEQQTPSAQAQAGKPQLSLLVTGSVLLSAQRIRILTDDLSPESRALLYEDLQELESLSLLSQKEAVVERMYRTHAFLWPRE